MLKQILNIIIVVISEKKVNKMQTITFDDPESKITFDEPESFDNYDVKEIQETSLEHFKGKLFNEIIWKFKFYMNIFESFEFITFKMNNNGNDKICIKGNFDDWKFTQSDLEQCSFHNNCWSVTFPIKDLLSKVEEIEFKFVKLKNNSINDPEWEGDKNRILNLLEINLNKEKGEYNKMQYSIDLVHKTITFICEWNIK